MLKILYRIIFKIYTAINKYQIKDIQDLDFIPRKFLIISNTALGDTLLSTPTIKSLKLSFPESEITFLVHKNYLDLFNGYQYVDKLIPFYGGYKKFIRTILKIKKSTPEIVLIPHSNGPQDIQISVMSGAQFILKHPTQTKLKKYLSYNFVKKEQHTIEDRLDLVRKINGNCIYTRMSLPELNNTDLIKKFHIFDGAIGMQVGAADIYKMWGVENFTKLAQHIKQHHPNISIIVTGNKKEKILADKINQNVDIINTCGEFSIKELPYLINSLKLLITNDTGTMHLAIALKIPTISLFSPTTVKGIGPYQNLELHKTIQKNGSYMQKLPKKQRSNEAMQLISVNEVFEKYLEFNR
jgi:ADP-heptose:LPS heptosyltransferase